MNRREMLLTAGAGAAALLLPRATLRAEDKGPFTLPKLPYDYDALEPIIDKMTMQIHHGKHHQAYVDNLNKAVAGKEGLAKMSIEEIVANVKKIEDAKLRQTVINNGGGDFNHTFFWQIMAPKGQGGMPDGDLAKAIESYGGLEKLKTEVLAAALGRFGSGWAWVEVADGGTLKVTHSPNQNNPWMDGKKAILGIDVWEHAYYLKYQNRRADYVKAWWDIANWKAIGENFNKAKA
jgi:Fe-Mn family superoxide dismutase